MRLDGGGALHVTGARTGSPVLFLHGVGGGAWSWEPQVAALERERPCWAFEARGHGSAARVADAGLGDYLRDAREALAAVVARDGPAIVAGHSMGGLLAMVLAAEQPADVSALALLEPVYAPDGGGHLHGLLGRTARTLVAPLVRSIVRDGAAARAVSRAVFDASFEDRAAGARAWRRQRTQVPVEYPKMMYEAFEGPSDFPIRAFARELAQPVLLVEGSAGNGGPRFPQLQRELESLGDRFTYLCIEGGHYLQLDRSAARVTRALREHVARWSP